MSRKNFDVVVVFPFTQNQSSGVLNQHYPPPLIQLNSSLNQFFSFEVHNYQYESKFVIRNTYDFLS